MTTRRKFIQLTAAAGVVLALPAKVESEWPDNITAAEVNFQQEIQARRMEDWREQHVHIISNPPLTTLANSGSGSLRQVLLDSPNGAWIRWR